MALSNDLRKRVVGAVVEDGLSRNAAARHFKVSIASAVRWVKRYETTGKISPMPSGGDRRSGRVEAQRDYLLGLIRRTPDITLLEIQDLCFLLYAITAMHQADRVLCVGLRTNAKSALHPHQEQSPASV
jgi:transposase